MSVEIGNIPQGQGSQDTSPPPPPPRPAIPPPPTRRDSLDIARLQAKAALFDSVADLSKIDDIMEDFNTDNGAIHEFEAKQLHRDMFKSLYGFYKSAELCDLNLKCGSKVFQCHKVVLATVSQYFRVMFTSEMAERNKEEVTIQDIDEIAMEQIIEFAYTAKISLTTENVQKLLYASSILQVEIVAKASCHFMVTHLHPSNCIGIRAFAEQHGRTELMKSADMYILDNLIGVFESEEFKIMTAKHLEETISCPDANVPSEETIYEGVMKWVKFDVEKNKQFLPRLISKVRLPVLSASYLMHNVAKEDLIRKDLECRDYLDEAKFYQLSQSGMVPGVKVTERMVPRKSYAGVLFCVGGRGTSGDPFRSIECYDLRKNRWFHVAEMTTKRRHVGVVSVDGKLFAIGGHDGSEHLSTGEVFDPYQNKWSSVAPMITLRRGIAVACLGGPIYAVGGLDDSTCYNIVERYDPKSDTWSSVQSMNIPRGGVGVAPLKGHLYAIGGNDGASSLDSCEQYNPHLDKWVIIEPMKKRRAGAGVAELGNKLYVVGGFDDNSPLNSVECYDPESNTWTLLNNMSTPRGGVGVAALCGKIYAVGGHDGVNYLNSVEAYDPITDSWEGVKNVTQCRAGAGVTYCDVNISRLTESMQLNISCV